MLKALLKKQFLELNVFYFQNRKTGKNRTKAGTVRMVLLFVLLFASVGFAFYGMGMLLCPAFHALQLDWLYFSIMGMIAIFLGVFGAVFNTYSGLYKSKDNELLLSMPIPPSKILFVRMTGVYAMGLLYESLVLIPASIVYWVYASPTVLSVIFTVLQIFIVGFLILALTCALGWVVALISSKLKNKTVITVLSSLALFLLYYFVYFRINSYLQTLVQNAQEISFKIKNSFYPFYLMGRAFEGKVLPMLAVTAITAVLIGLTYFILSKTFIKIVTAKTSEQKKEYKEKPVKASSVKSALLKKELKRFFSSPAYMLNSGFGIILAPVFAIAALIYSDKICEGISMLSWEFPEIAGLAPVAAAGIICLLLSMNCITAPSVSLEGKNIWIAQSLPVNAADILQAKQNLHMVLNIPAALILSIGLGIAMKSSLTEICYIVLITCSFVMLVSSAGLALNLKNPNLVWTNETIPIKQSASVTITLFGGWILAVGIVGIAYLLRNTISTQSYMIYAAVLIFVASSLIDRWIKNKGAKIFSQL